MSFKMVKQLTLREGLTNLYMKLRSQMESLFLGRNQMALFQTLDKGSEEEQNLLTATYDLFERFKDVDDLPESVMNTMALILLDIEYVRTTNASGEDRVFTVDPIDPFNHSVDKMLKYAKFLVDIKAEQMLNSCMAALLVKMATYNMTYKESESTQNGRYEFLHHYMLFESIPEMRGRLLHADPMSYLKDGKTCIKFHHVSTEKPIVHAPGFSGFVAKSAASMVNKMYCRRGKNKKNFIGDRVRSRVTVDSIEELNNLFQFFSSHCYYAATGTMDGNSRQLLLTHMELIKKFMAGDSSVEQYMFKIPKFEHEADIDCGPWRTLQLIPIRVKWNASCFRGSAVNKNVFNLNYYLNCPMVTQTIEGLTMLSCEMQFGTRQAFEELQANHVLYDRARIFDTNEDLQNFYSAVKNGAMKDGAAITYTEQEKEFFSGHYKSFPALTIVMNEAALEKQTSPPQGNPIVSKVGGQGGDAINAFNYQGIWGAIYPSAIVWEYHNTGQRKLRFLKTVKLWGSDQGWGDEGHSSCALIATIGDFQYVIGRRTLFHQVKEYHFVQDYRFLSSEDSDVASSVVLGDLVAYDRIALVIRSAPHPGHEAKAYGFEVEYIAEDASRL